MSETPRRAEMTKWVAAERAIYDAVQAVEEMPADVRLTDAAVLLQAARASVADYVDGISTRRSVYVEQSDDDLITTGQRLLRALRDLSILRGRALALEAQLAAAHAEGRREGEAKERELRALLEAASRFLFYGGWRSDAEAADMKRRIDAALRIETRATAPTAAEGATNG